MSDDSPTNIDLDLPNEAVVTGRIEIVTYMTPGVDDYMITAKASSGGENMPLITSFGMLELAKGLLERAHDGDDDE